MPIDRMDHFTILTTNSQETVAFYYDILGLTPGPRPDFSFPGAWLYNGGRRCFMSSKNLSFRKAAGSSTISLSWGTDVPAYIAKLKARGIKYDLRRLPQSGHAAGVWQLFFFDPSGARVEIDFAATESAEPQS